jgi:hypothetical protein
MGVVLPILLVAALIATITIAVLRRRSPGEPTGA